MEVYNTEKVKWLFNIISKLKNRISVMVKRNCNNHVSIHLFTSITSKEDITENTSNRKVAG